MLLFETKKTLLLYGAIVVRAYQNELKANKKIATGGTIASLQNTVVAEPLVLGFRVLGDKVFDYIEFGRRAGAKLPPKGVLLPWLKVKGMSPKLEYIIRKSIAAKGIAPVPVSENVKQIILPRMQVDVETALGRDIETSFVQYAKSIL